MTDKDKQHLIDFTSMGFESKRKDCLLIQEAEVLFRLFNFWEEQNFEEEWSFTDHQLTEKIVTKDKQNFSVQSSLNRI